VPPAVSAVVMRTLQKRPADRFAAMEEVIAALASPSTGTAAKPARPRSRRLWLALLALPLALGGFLWMRPAPSPLLRIPDLPLPTSDKPEAVALYAKALRDVHGGSLAFANQELRKALTLDPTLAAASVRIVANRYGSPLLRADQLENWRIASHPNARLSERDRALLHAFEPGVTDDPPNHTQVAERLEALLARWPGDQEVGMVLARALSQGGQSDRALAVLDQIIVADPSFTLGYFLRGDALDAKGDVVGTLAQYRKCADLFPRAGTCGRNASLLMAERGHGRLRALRARGVTCRRSGRDRSKA
jgi:tetratricopeptide (TPR) repeat protein